MPIPFDLEHAGVNPHDGKVAIIDIGSNSIRLVVYDSLKRAPMPLYNEKVMCALGKGLGKTGQLNQEGVAQATASIRRFLTLTRLMDVMEIDILATAAIRDAEDGQEFVDTLEREHNISIHIISGNREAKLAALGVLSSIHAPSGLVGDLGGGSMELVELDGNRTGQQVTLPIGPLRLLDASGGDKDKIRTILRSAFNETTWLARDKTARFYAVGGSFRAIAKIYMAKNVYPLHILHHYAVPANSLSKFLKEIIGMSASEVAALPEAPGKRANAILPAAQVLEAVIQHCGVEEVVFSMSGIREGYLFDKLSPYVRGEDGLIAACADLASQNGRVAGYAKELFTWMSSLFPEENEDEMRLRLACCILSEIGWRIHNEYRAEWAFNRVLQSTLISLNHHERLTLATALYHRYQYKMKDVPPVLKLLDDRRRIWARAVGIAANLAYNISGSVAGNLHKTQLSYARGKVTLELAHDIQDMMGDTVAKRIEGLGETLSALSKSAK